MLRAKAIIVWCAKLVAGLLFILLCMPMPSSNNHFSKSLYGREGTLLSATVSKDGQWHLPYKGAIPNQLSTAVRLYEDEYLHYHLGINPVAIVKAIKYNLRKSGNKRGASTLPMQIMRMRNKGKRTMLNKCYESICAIKYSLFNSKETIMEEWCDRASFGGNTVGVYTASVRYFGRPLDQLSWAESALLAILPNSPTYAHLNKNRSTLKAKRDALLRKLARKGYIDRTVLPLYIDEDLPLLLNEIPSDAYHLLTFATRSYPDQSYFKSTVNPIIQRQVNLIVQEEHKDLRIQGIDHLCAIVTDVTTNELVAYVGNVQNASRKFNYIDLAQRPRSYGSLLKPFLYGLALDEGYYLPQELVPDIPTSYGEYRPENFDKKYRGAVSLDDIIIQSLNVPAVRVLNTVGIDKFSSLISNLNIKYLDKGANHYGLSIILGGGETSLWELSRMYKGLAQNYIGVSQQPFSPITYLIDQEKSKKVSTYKFSAYAISHTVTAMADLTRPREDRSWSMFGINNKIAWKTGTSYGHRDAWAMGFNGKYQVAVWVGNADGSQRMGLIGIEKAAPVLFKIFNQLPGNKWFDTAPNIEKSNKIAVCTESGKMIGPLCNHTKTLTLPLQGFQFTTCTNHQIVTNALKTLDTVFALPPSQEYYYRVAHFNYNNSALAGNSKNLEIVYPQPGVKIVQPLVDDQRGVNSTVLKAHHRSNNAKVFWYLDGKYVNTSQQTHALNMVIEPGKHHLVVVDEAGQRDDCRFEVLGLEE